MTRGIWHERLQCLAVRLPEYGMSADLSALSIAELWSLYRFLQRMTGS
jgi:hypothetical protein